MGEEVKRILTKKEAYQLYEAGLFGNKAITWNSYKEILKSGWKGLVCMRSKAGTARKNVKYNLNIQDVPAVIEEWNKLGIKEEQIAFNQNMPDKYLTLQGEIMKNENGLFLIYTKVKKPMNLALREKEEYVFGLSALKILKEYLWPSSFSDIEALLDIYSDSVIEFSAYESAVGNIPGRNAVIWEVRNY